MSRVDLHLAEQKNACMRRNEEAIQIVCLYTTWESDMKGCDPELGAAKRSRHVAECGPRENRDSDK